MGNASSGVFSQRVRGQSSRPEVRVACADARRQIVIESVPWKPGVTRRASTSTATTASSRRTVALPWPPRRMWRSSAAMSGETEPAVATWYSERLEQVVVRYYQSTRSPRTAPGQLPRVAHKPPGNHRRRDQHVRSSRTSGVPFSMDQVAIVPERPEKGSNGFVIPAKADHFDVLKGDQRHGDSPFAGRT